MTPTFSVCVYCGSKPGASPDFATTARAVGHWIGARGGQLVYGGGKNGLMGIEVPVEYGGAGMDSISYALAMIEIAAADCAHSTIMSVNNTLYCNGLLKFGSEAQKQKYVRPIASGEAIGAFALTEPQSGSDLGGIRTKAEPNVTAIPVRDWINVGSAQPARLLGFDQALVWVVVALLALAPRFRAHYAPQKPPPDSPLDPYRYKLEKRRYACARVPSLSLPTGLEDPAAWAPLFPLQPMLAWAPERLGSVSLTRLADEDQPMLDWLTLHLEDPLYGRGNPVDRAFAPLPSLLAATERYGNLLFDQFDRHGVRALDPALAPQLHALTSQLCCGARNLIDDLKAVVDEGRAKREFFATQQRLLRAAEEAQLVVVGESQRPGQFFKIGKDAKDRQIAVTAETPQVIVISGLTGYGKTHIMKVLAEAARFHMPGLNALSEPQRTVMFESDCNKGFTRRQSLAGFSPNLSAEQLAYLHEHYGYKARGNEAYTRGTLAVLPAAVERLRRELAPLVERGLVIVPTLLGPQDLGMAGYRALLANARCMQGAQKPHYLTRLEALISKLGDNLTPQRLIKAIQGGKFTSTIEAGLIDQLLPLVELVVPGARFNDIIRSVDPAFVILETLLLSPDFLLPFQACLMNALRLQLRDGSHPFRWLFIDEYNKMAENAVMIEFNREQGQERRHNPVSLVFNGQRVSGMDRGFLSQATIMVVFRTTNRLEIRALKDNFLPFADLPDEVFGNLSHGECLIGAIQSTGNRDVYQVKIRPTLSHAGGETVRVVA